MEELKNITEINKCNYNEIINNANIKDIINLFNNNNKNNNIDKNLKKNENNNNKNYNNKIMENNFKYNETIIDDSNVNENYKNSEKSQTKSDDALTNNEDKREIYDYLNENQLNKNRNIIYYNKQNNCKINDLSDNLDNKILTINDNDINISFNPIKKEKIQNDKNYKNVNDIDDNDKNKYNQLIQQIKKLKDENKILKLKNEKLSEKRIQSEKEQKKKKNNELVL